MRSLAVALLLLAACYPGVDNSDCKIVCGEDDACPSNLSCDGRFCVTEGQVCADPALVLAYSFDELDGSDLPDDSFTGNTARLRGDPDLVDAVHGKGLSFDGNDDACLTPHDPTLAVAPGGAFTVEMWIFIEPMPSLVVDQIIVAKVWMDGMPVAPFYEFGVEFDSTSQSIELFVGDEDAQIHRAFFLEPALGELVHLAFTWDGNIVAGYLDGVAQPFTDPELEVVVPDRGQSLVIGSQTDEQEFFRGTLDDLRIYNRALSAAEIARDMDTPVRR